MERQTSVGPAAPQGTDMQKALLSIRQARDSVLAQNHELISKLSKAEEALSVTTAEKETMEVEREVALKRAEKYMVDCDELLRKNHELEGRLKDVAGSPNQSAELHEKIAALTASLATLTQQNEELAAERKRNASAHSELTARVATLTQQNEELAAERTQIASAHAELTGSVAALTQQNEEFAAERAQNASAHSELTTVRAELTKANAELTAERAQSTNDLAEQSRLLDEQRRTVEQQGRRIAELTTELETKQSSGQAEQLSLSLMEATRRIADLEAQSEGFRTQQRKNIVVLTKTLTSERETLCQKYNEEIGALKAHLQDLQTQLALAKEAAEAAGTTSIAATALTERLEQQRLENDELAAQLEATRIENRELRAALDETRATDSPVPPAETAALPDEEAARAYDASVALGAMMSCIEMLTEHPGGLELIQELEDHLRGFGDRANAAGLRGIHQYTASCVDLTNYLRKTPAKISVETLSPLQEAISLLTSLVGTRNPAQVFDPAEALVYAVDDDLDNCECIAMALEKVQLRTKYAGRPEVALTEITASPCDLIILDVDMPRMDGFELAGHIRQLPQHARTPIIFLSGLVSTEERLASSGITDATYMPKPYNLKELGLRVFTRILHARGNLA